MISRQRTHMPCTDAASCTPLILVQPFSHFAQVTGAHYRAPSKREVRPQPSFSSAGSTFQGALRRRICLYNYDLAPSNVEQPSVGCFAATTISKFPKKLAFGPMPRN